MPFVLIINLDDNEDGVEVGHRHDVPQHSHDLLVHLHSLFVLIDVPLAHDALEALRDDGDQEVKKDDQYDECVKEREHPNQHQHCGGFHLRILVQLLISWIHWRRNISDRVPVSLDQDYCTHVKVRVVIICEFSP